jgi:hypothetical protein
MGRYRSIKKGLIIMPNPAISIACILDWRCGKKIDSNRSGMNKAINRCSFCPNSLIGKINGNITTTPLNNDIVAML